MKRNGLALVLVLMLVLMLVPVAAFGWTGEPDDDIPGVQPQWSVPIQAYLGNNWDVYRVYLQKGEEFSFDLWTGPAYSCSLFLYPPGTASHLNGSAVPFKVAEDGGPTQHMAGTADRSGWWFLAVTGQGGNAANNPYTLDADFKLSVYRFYNKKNGSHFYTPSAEERDHVIATYPAVFDYEGPAYTLNSTCGRQALYRFYNMKNGSHFYTASDAERDAVISTWPGVYQYEGPTYSVSPFAVTGFQAVYRFYNKTNGSHFYTASEEERDAVKATWPHVYDYEGAAFWLPVKQGLH
jgi:hypothetical protein